MILTINGGSSSIKFSLYKLNEPLQKMLFGEIENIGTAKVKLNFTIIADQQKNTLPIEAKDHHHAATHLIDWLEKQEDFTSVKAIGHRIV